MTGQLGIGAMIHLLGGGSEHSSDEYAGRLIVAAHLDAEADLLRLTFSDGKTIEVWDAGQSCCETRYMRTDDDLSTLIGHRLVHIASKVGPNEPDDYGEHETCFVEIQTDGGLVTLTNHNEHNGYYGGFGLTITEAAQ